MIMTIKRITKLAAVAALYIVFTLINPFSFEMVQFRISEILILLCFYRRDYSYALIVGCFIANLFGPMGYVDALFGTLATTISVFLISRSKNLILAGLYPVLLNGVIVGLELHYILEFPLLTAMGFVALGEFVVVTTVGVILFMILTKNDGFLDLIEANQNLPQH
ncbi:MAG TPA: QueT transporter family protein [Acholeplasmataceae bacterium]|nr:QueT transporter family protein [Acholeplasmataceae bacterium]